MPFLWILIALIIIASVAFVLGRQRAVQSAGGDSRKLHSLPGFYGWNTAIGAMVPSIAILAVWMIAQPIIVNMSIAPMITSVEASDSATLGLVLSNVTNVSEGLDAAIAAGAITDSEVAALNAETDNIKGLLSQVGKVVGSDITPEILDAARASRDMNATGTLFKTIVVLAAAIAGGAFALTKIRPDLWARNQVETFVRYVLITAASIAILTTIGIVLSLIFNTVKFFGMYSATDFFFGLSWLPRFQGESDLGILPLMWGTVYISIIALLVAVPIGLFAAIYLSEYASKGVRAVAKPALEVLAGIPTIVYGLFALLTVGPLLKSAFGDGGVLGVQWMGSADAAMTAGLVMGIMLIPFVSSLSDDIINAVPQAMRDGSYGLGATKSETIKQVVLPAALPGIVGAVLLAASRAIGETMIVVLGAGAAAQLSLNPFDAMTTVTTRIVAQLTGDTDFASATALVAFALGMTLFVVTLGLNILALYIVRKYREQYE
ncbi:MAG: phosphate ABC transporter permease subunit PstC [Marivivens sp.]|uniref:phosphate ABC transporter permease subunit PstC n=1 Tax=Marivivens sp. TaxID=1978374 RepID=UPI0017D88EE0|nr:phosphate ABC transporter permease subunit PstC [Marivivens sp.]NVJ95848.1 phosphate ABC transporter permease subunit PstC [Marivivens sp.]